MYFKKGHRLILINVWDNYLYFETVKPAILIHIANKLLDSHYSSSSLCRSVSTDIPGPLSPPLAIVHCFRQVLRATSHIGTELLYVVSSWSSSLCSSTWRDPREYITYELIPTSPAVSCISVRLILIVFVMDGRWPNSCCFAGFCLQELFNIACSILVQLPSSFYSIRLVSVNVVHPYSSIDTTAAWKKLRFILSVRSDFHMTDSLSIAVYAFASHVSMSWLMRHCSLGRWTCQLVSEIYHLVWRCRLFDWTTFIPSCVHWHGRRCLQQLIPVYVAGFRLGRVHLPEALHLWRSPRR